jgi:hypothetical protein
MLFFEYINRFVRYIFHNIFGISTYQTVEAPSVIIPQQEDNSMSENLAVLVGINKYVSLSGSDLNGCVNDVNDMYDRLTKNFGFEEDNVRVLCDERATQQNILERLEWLISNAKRGSQLVFQYSGHGSSVRCRNEDTLENEECQILCPTDMDWDSPLTDKILASFFRRIPEGAFLTFVCDACHSGSMDRGMPTGNPHVTKVRYLKPPFDIAVRSRNRNLPVNRVGWKDLFGPRSASNVAFFNTRHLLISGCRDNQTSADAFIGGQYNGAMTASLKNAIDSNNSIDWLSAHELMLKYLKEEGYSQIPQLSGPELILKKSVFRGV